MSIPKLTAEQRAEALQKAQQMRTERMILRQELKTGRMSLAQLFERAGEEMVGKMRVKYLLESMPQVGKVTAAKLMEEIGIDESRRVQGLGNRQKADLLERFAE